METATKASQPWAFTIKLWPPSESTREMLVERITKNLSAESILSLKYGLLDKEEAFEHATHIEKSCFAIADKHFENEPDGDGSSAVQLYAKETSKLMLEALRRGPRPKIETPISATEASVLPQKQSFFDISAGPRDFLDSKMTRELLSPLAEEANSFTKICFSNRSFGIEAAEVAGPILSLLKDQLVDVDLSDFIAGRPEDEALEVMRIFSSALEGCTLKRLDLSNNAMGEKGVRAFEALLRSQDRLEELYLINGGISEEAAKALCEIIPSTEKLIVLHFHNNMMGDEGAIAVAEVIRKCPLMEDFRCSSTRVDSEGSVILAESLQICNNLKKLDLRDNLFGVEAGLTLSKTLEGLQRITELYLSYLNLENKGAIAIFDALKHSVPGLEILEIAGNEITVKAASNIAACLREKHRLKKLSLSENELRDEGAILIGKVLEGGSNSELQELDFSFNGVKRVGARCLVRAVLANKPDFVLLNIDGNAISEEGIDEVREMLKAGNKGEGVLGPLDENDPEEEGYEDKDDEDEASNDDDDDDHEANSKIQNLSLNL